jgi:hypothetical protein
MGYLQCPMGENFAMTDQERDDEVGAESADLSPAAIAAEAERLRILRETMMRRREM